MVKMMKAIKDDPSLTRKRGKKRGGIATGIGKLIELI
jgi:hypothetical protein